MSAKKNYPTRGYLPVIWSYLARLDEVPCDIFIRSGGRTILYATTGSNPETLREKAREGVPLVVREADTYLLRRMLNVSLKRTLADTTIPPTARSKEAYAIAASIVSHTFRPRARFDRDEATLVQETVDMLTGVFAKEDDSLWTMVASMQRNMQTHSHAINTAIYSLGLAKAAGITDADQLRDIGRAGLLVDIGLTTVPARVLERPPEELDAQEIRVLRQHPVVGYAIVTRALGQTPPYAHVILEHHERLDGSGYPSGRRGGQIAIDSQVVAIADVYDELTTGRFGRPPLAPFDACQQMRFARPGQFSDALMRDFIALLGGWSAIRLSIAS